MARRLKAEEAEVFNGAKDTDEIPTDADAFLRSLRDQQEESQELTLVPGLWISSSPPERSRR